MSQKNNEFDKKTIFKQLKASLDADKLYWLQNDAKIKAVQTAKCYDEFKETVAAAHLQPLLNKDKTSNQKCWNILANTLSNQ